MRISFITTSSSMCISSREKRRKIFVIIFVCNKIVDAIAVKILLLLSTTHCIEWIIRKHVSIATISLHLTRCLQLSFWRTAYFYRMTFRSKNWYHIYWQFSKNIIFTKDTFFLHVFVQILLVLILIVWMNKTLTVIWTIAMMGIMKTMIVLKGREINTFFKQFLLIGEETRHISFWGIISVWGGVCRISGGNIPCGSKWRDKGI